MTEKHTLQQEIIKIETLKRNEFGEKAKSCINQNVKKIGINGVVCTPNNNKNQKISLAAVPSSSKSSTPNDDERNRIYEATSSQTTQLKELGKARRDYTENVIINVLKKKIAEIYSHNPTYPSHRICVLIAIWVSLKTTSNTSCTYYSGVCKVQLLGNLVKNTVMYRRFSNNYYQVPANDIGDQMQTLTAQLQQNLSIPLELTPENE
ncbi:uncharacterized protein LOC126842053 [Adelges cooleyi]|nr:uncharacterized protein LOC126842053 [Adelges cooleyi]